MDIINIKGEKEMKEGEEERNNHNKTKGNQYR